MSNAINIGWDLFQNPENLENFGSNVRGVITYDGDLFLENFSNGTIHNDILDILFKRKVIKGEFKRNWTTKTPQETGFITVQRFKDTPVIAIGESNRLLYSLNSYSENIKFYNEFIEKAKIKSPNITFSNKLIRIKAMFTGDHEVVINVKDLEPKVGL